ncbi:hypothetical protein KZZ52_17730 [Dactylosporangium sp. AC04546]|uniref:hypothetical protein n=1 Tax=Dactylosporangium sp. AC04546 TaxID=2862460 RepID=UPI001EDED7F1|nr:hypothetical protein [Dactylosporangium sp. AC04546]WVK87140.1 hypothetical protein KZZ52_17730 [Dactylosporangium sp. AC04546]
MNESQLHAALDSYTDDPPTALPDSAVMLAVARRARRNRTVLTAGIGVFAALTAVATGIAVTPGRPGTPAAKPSPIVITSCAGQRPDTPVQPDQPIPDDLATWGKNTVTCYLKAALPSLVPGATFEQVQGAPAGPLIGFILPLGQTGPSRDGRPLNDRVDAVSIIRDSQGAGDLWLTIGVTSPGEKDREIERCRAGSTCTVQSGPNGATALIVSAQPNAVPFSQNWVQVYRGNSTIWIGATDTDRKARGGLPERTRPTPILTTDQLLELSYAQDLLLYP